MFQVLLKNGLIKNKGDIYEKNKTVWEKRVKELRLFKDEYVKRTWDRFKPNGLQKMNQVYKNKVDVHIILESDNFPKMMTHVRELLGVKIKQDKDTEKSEFIHKITTVGGLSDVQRRKNDPVL